MEELSRRQKAFTIAGTLLGLLLAALDNTIVATAAPAIQRDLGIHNAQYAWITIAYLVASTVLVPVWGKLSDLYGRKPILLVGMTVFLVGSTLCGLAWDDASLILFRAVQGVGSASLFTTAFAVIADMFPPAERGKYQGIYGAVFGIASVVGPLVGGVITEQLSWHWVFFVNLPIGGVALAFVAARMPRLQRPRSGPARVDVAGALALIVGVVPLLLAVSLGHSGAPVAVPGEGAAIGWSWGSWQILGLFALAATGLAAFVVIELRVAEPLLDLRLFGDRVFARSNAAAFVVGMSFLGPMVFLPLFMVKVVGLSLTSSGLTTVPLTFGIVAGNIGSGQIVSRMGRYKPVMLVSLVILIASFVVMGYTLTTASTQLEVSLKMFFVGIGLGPTIPLYTVAVQNAVPPQQIGVATSTATFSRALGVTVGAAILSGVFSSTLSAGLVAADPLPVAMTAAIEKMFRVCGAVAIASLLVTLGIPSLPLRRGGPPAPIGE
jgi:EmrB/QacA subfamily drug resistance transporter